MASEPTKPAAATTAVASATDAKAEKKQKHKMTKEEKIAHRSQEVDALMASVTEKAKALTGTDKKMAELAIAHADLEIKTAKDEEMKNHAGSHLAKAERFLKNAEKHLGKHHKETAKVEEKKDETKK